MTYETWPGAHIVTRYPDTLIIHYFSFHDNSAGGKHSDCNIQQIDA